MVGAPYRQHAMLVRHLGKTLNVKHIAAWVADGLAEEALGVGAELLLDALVVPVGVNEGTLDAEFLHGHAKEVERAAIDSVGGDEVVASLADVEHGVEVGSLTAAGQHSTHTTFEGSNLLGHHVVGRVGQTSVKIAGILQVEETSHLLAGVILEGSALIDGQLLRFTLGWFPSAMHADGLKILLTHIMGCSFLSCKGTTKKRTVQIHDAFFL